MASALALAVCLAPAVHAAPAPSGGVTKLMLVPPKLKISGRGMTQRYLVLAQYSGGETRDVTDTAQVSVSGAGVTVDAKTHTLTSTINGEAKVAATVGGAKAVMAVSVTDAERKQEWSFANEIVPIFTKSGCNSGGCHGSPSGRGGFKLSLFGYEPDYDYEMLVKQLNGKRVNTVQPKQSLVLRKPTMETPHGGGMRFKPGSEFYSRILDWLSAGAPKQAEFDPRLQRIEIYPSEWTLERSKEQQRVVVVGVRDDGTTQDVTAYARFTSNDDQVASVDEEGVIEAQKPGETSIMVRYLGGVGIVRVEVPRPVLPVTAFANFTPVNYIDQRVLERLKEVRIAPSGLAGDAEFLRRAYLDTTGSTPTIEEARAFLDSKDPAKRTKLVDALLGRPEYLDYWTLRWSDLLRNNQSAKQDKGLQVFNRWIRECVRDNKPYDEMARELITASGSAFRNGPANWYNLGDVGAEYPLSMASATSQVFLGIRIDCARCHNHPFESWSQMDYYGLAAFFARLKTKPGVDENEKIFFAATEGDVKHPRTEAVIPAKFLGGDTTKFAFDEDRRDRLAEWITNPKRNPWFARSIANRLWNNFFGRGIVHPVDDYRLTNPAANEKLLSALADKLVEYKFDLKRLMRDILLSRTYQAASTPAGNNAEDRVYASHALPRRLHAEVLMDAVIRATEVPAKFGPYESAVAIPDNRVGDGSGFLELFGRSRRENACECERSEETNVGMVLNLLTGSTVNDRITSPEGRVGRAVAANRPPKQIVEEFYLAALSRRPTAKEEAAALKLISSAPNLKEGAEDLMWGLLNMKEFMFNH